MVSREPSAAPSSSGDTIDDQPEDVKPIVTDDDRDTPALDIAQADTPSSIRSTKRGRDSSVKKPRPRKGAHVWINGGPGDATEDDIKRSGTPDADSKILGTAVGTRRQANGTVGSVFSGSKNRHLKKPDGTPLWRKEIQYEFLRLVVEDAKPVFTRFSDGKKNCSFADIYTDCMAGSSKLSKVLKERLQVDKEAAQNMAMICLLVNVGRMNTTLNFFPEMRAQLRTYHSIPSLQAYKSQKDYKSLQDAPRLKSILKGASEDVEQPRTVPSIKAAPIPRTNAVNLIFVLSQFASDVAQDHFVDKVDFFDLVIRPTISSKSRARAFLWLMWWYLESDFSRQAALNNPFGPGEFRDDQDSGDPTQIPQLVPRLENITEEEGDAENEDPDEEKAFAERMTRERKRLMAEFNAADAGEGNIEHKVVKRLKKSTRDFDDDSDMDSTQASSGAVGHGSVYLDGASGAFPSNSATPADGLDDDPEVVDPHPGRGRYKRVKGKGTLARGKTRTSDAKTSRGRSSGQAFDRGTPDTVGARATPQPLRPNISHHSLVPPQHRAGPDASQPTKSRARTGYQRQLEEHRNSRIEWLLKRKRREVLKLAQGRRDETDFIVRVARRVQDFDPTYDSEEDEKPSFFAANIQSSRLSVISTTTTAQIDGKGLLQAQPSPFATGIGGLIARHGSPINHEGDDGRIALARALGTSEPDDYGEEAEAHMKLFKRAKRRLLTWSGERDLDIYESRRDHRRPAMPGLGAKRAEKKAAAAAAKNAKPPAPSEASLRAIKAPTRAQRKAAGGGRRGGGTPLRRSIKTIGDDDGTPSSRATAKRGRDLEDEITQGLLAERSEGDDDGSEGDSDGDGDGDVDGDLDGDGDGDGGDDDIGMDDAEDGDGGDASEMDMD